MSSEGIAFRRATDDDVPALRRLVNAAYRPLGEMGLNFTGVTQDEATTRARMAGHEVYLAEREGRVIGTVSLQRRDRPGLPPHLYVNQLAVDPALQGHGLGSRLMDLAERRAIELGLNWVRLDTAIPAEHLVRWYGGRGYVAVGEAQWRGKTYRSVIMAKSLRGRSGREAAVFVHRTGDLLLMRRARDGVWHVPAGVVEAGETFLGAAERELAEETGLRDVGLVDLGCEQRCAADRKHYVYPEGIAEVVLANFAAEAPAGWEPILDTEHTEHRWAPFEEARGLLHFAQARSALDVLRAKLVGSALR